MSIHQNNEQFDLKHFDTECDMVAMRCLSLFPLGGFFGRASSFSISGREKYGIVLLSEPDMHDPNGGIK